MDPTGGTERDGNECVTALAGGTAALLEPPWCLALVSQLPARARQRGRVACAAASERSASRSTSRGERRSPDSAHHTSAEKPTAKLARDDREVELAEVMFSTQMVEAVDQLRHSVDTMISCATEASQSLPNPLWVPTPKNRRYVAARQLVHGTITGLIGQRREPPEAAFGGATSSG